MKNQRSIANPEKYLGRLCWSRRNGKLRVVEYLGGRIFRVVSVDRYPGVHFQGGLGTTYRLLK